MAGQGRVRGACVSSTRGPYTRTHAHTHIQAHVCHPPNHRQPPTHLPPTTHHVVAEPRRPVAPSGSLSVPARPALVHDVEQAAVRQLQVAQIIPRGTTSTAKSRRRRRGDGGRGRTGPPEVGLISQLYLAYPEAAAARKPWPVLHPPRHCPRARRSPSRGANKTAQPWSPLRHTHTEEGTKLSAIDVGHACRSRSARTGRRRSTRHHAAPGPLPGLTPLRGTVSRLTTQLKCKKEAQQAGLPGPTSAPTAAPHDVRNGVRNALGRCGKGATQSLRLA